MAEAALVPGRGRRAAGGAAVTGEASPPRGSNCRFLLAPVACSDYSIT